MEIIVKLSHNLMQACINNYMSTKGKSFYNNGIVCIRATKCPIGFVKGRLKYKRKKASEETKLKISDSLKNRIPHNKGKRGVSEATSRKMSIAAKARAKRGIMPDNTGNIAWNRGLTAADDERIKQYAESQRGQVREGNWYTVDYDIKEFHGYRDYVRRLTERTYTKYKKEINPNDLPRGTAGQNGAYHLDHIIPILYGFKNNIQPEILAEKENLRMIPWEDNLSRQRNYKNEEVACMTELMANAEWK